MTFTTITTKELEELSIKKISGAATQVYLALRLHTWGTKTSCFPSIDRLSKLLGGSYTTRTIQRALKQLEDTGIIKRNKAHTLNRFVLLAKKAAETVKETAKKVIQKVSSNETDLSSQKKNKRNQYQRYCNKREKQKKNKYHKKPRPTPSLQSFRKTVEGLNLHMSVENEKKVFIDRILALEKADYLTEKGIDQTFKAGKALHEAIWKTTYTERATLKAQAEKELRFLLEIIPEHQKKKQIEAKMVSIVQNRTPEIASARLWEAINAEDK